MITSPHSYSSRGRGVILHASDLRLHHCAVTHQHIRNSDDTVLVMIVTAVMLVAAVMMVTAVMMSYITMM